MMTNLEGTEHFGNNHIATAYMNSVTGVKCVNECNQIILSTLIVF